MFQDWNNNLILIWCKEKPGVKFVQSIFLSSVTKKSADKNVE